MKRTVKVGSILMICLGLITTGCKKKGCIDGVAKNFDVEAQKDDGTCEYYTNTEFLTMSQWKYSNVVSADPAQQADIEQFLAGVTLDYSTDGTYDIVIPSDTSAGVTDGTWEFTADESGILQDKGKEDEQTIKVTTLNIDTAVLVFNDNGNDITLTVVH